MDDRSKIVLATNAVVSGLAAVAGVIDPVAGILAASSAPAALEAAERAAAAVQRRQSARRHLVLAAAAEHAGVSVDELLQRFLGDPDREYLLLRTLRACENAALTDKLVAYSIALAQGSDATDPIAVAWEAAFVRALEDVDASHLALLRKLTMSAAALGLTERSIDQTFSEPFKIMLNDHQLAMVAADVPNLPAAIAVLRRHGLIEEKTAGGGGLGQGGGATHVRISSFGSDFLDRLNVIGDVLRKAAQP